jgi:uncharacterized protein affecting Mg2+/Co2+ transport
MEMNGLERLDKILIVEIFSFVPVKDYKNLAVVSRLFRECTRVDYLWKDACLLLFPEISHGFYQAFMENFCKFKRISDSFYKIIRKLGEGGAFELVSKLKATSNPRLLNILPHYISETNQSKLDKKSSLFQPLPKANTEELAWSHLLYNGQTILDPGLFGCYEFYDVYVSLAYMRLDQTQSPNIIARSENDGQFLMIFQDSDNTLKEGKGAVYCTTGFRKFLYLAGSFAEYLESFANKLTNGVLRMQQGKILLHEYNEYSSCNSEYGIKITASALFVPHLSQPGRFTWTYLITIEDDNVERTYKLTTRTWNIEDSNGEVSKVDRQPGVIGMYPKVMRGSEPFSYSSCCSLKTLSGTMSGYFTFLDQVRQTTIDVNIRPFRLEIPLGSRVVG